MQPINDHQPIPNSLPKKIPKSKKSIEHKTDAVGRKPLTQGEKAARKEKLRANKNEVRFKDTIVHHQLYEKPDAEWYEIPNDIPLIDEGLGDTGPSKKELQELEKQSRDVKKDHDQKPSQDLFSPNEDGYSYGKKLKKVLAKKSKLGPKKTPNRYALRPRLDPKNSSQQITGRPYTKINHSEKSPTLQDQVIDLEDLFKQAMGTVNSDHFIWADLVDTMHALQKSHVQLDIEDIAFFVVYGVKVADKSKLPNTLAQICTIHKGKEQQLNIVKGYLNRLRTGNYSSDAQDFAEIISSVSEKCGIKISSNLMAEAERLSKNEITEFVRKKRAEKEKAEHVIVKNDLIILEKTARQNLRSTGVIFKWETVEEKMKELITDTSRSLNINYDLIKSYHIINHVMHKAKLDALVRLRDAAKEKFSIKETVSLEKIEKTMNQLLNDEELEFDLLGEDEITSQDIKEFINQLSDTDEVDDDI